MTQRYLTPRLLMLALLLAFVGPASSARAAVVRASTDASKPILGYGYSTQGESFKQPCVQGTVTYAGAQSATLSLVMSMSQGELESSLGFSVGAKARYGLYTASASAKFARASRASDRSVSLIYSAQYGLQNAILTDPKMTEAASQALSGMRWDTICGDQFVQEIVRGAALYFTIRIDFTSKAQQQVFEAAFKLDSPFVGLDARLRQASSKFDRQTKVTISALQIGGDATKISTMFGAPRCSREG